jgi:hypothetical protein
MVKATNHVHLLVVEISPTLVTHFGASTINQVIVVIQTSG